MADKHAPPEFRFWAKVLKHEGENACWEWVGARTPNGYGYFYMGRPAGGGSVHRYAYELQNGPLPPGMWALHHCDNKPCVRGNHLYAGTAMDNANARETRGRGPQSSKTHCVRGHLLTSENLYPSGLLKKVRHCRLCRPFRVERNPGRRHRKKVLA
jgi:hypothetical protein